MESDLYHNGFYDKTWSYIRFAFDSTQFEKPKDSLDVLSLIANYSKVKGLILRNELAMFSAVKKYLLLIEKGNLLSEEINDYLK